MTTEQTPVDGAGDPLRLFVHAYPDDDRTGPKMDPEGWFFGLAETSSGLGIEHYQLLSGQPGPAGPNGLEDDLFAGIRAR